jgi:uncharacterized RDD family membrane protein YckC
MENPIEPNKDNFLELESAPIEKRVLNFIIDWIFVQLFIFVTTTIIVILFGEKAINFYNNIIKDFYLSKLFVVVIFIFYMGTIEALMKGKSMGKLLTGTKAVNDYDDSEISATTAFYRAIIRIVPFDWLSALGTNCRPFHDSMTRTRVVLDKKEEITLY